MLATRSAKKSRVGLACHLMHSILSCRRATKSVSACDRRQTRTGTDRLAMAPLACSPFATHGLISLSVESSKTKLHLRVGAHCVLGGLLSVF